MLNTWEHPKTGETRLYFQKEIVQAALEHAGLDWPLSITKVWIEPDSENWKIKVHIKSDEAVSKIAIRQLKESVAAKASLAANSSWSDLLIYAQQSDGARHTHDQYSDDDLQALGKDEIATGTPEQNEKHRKKTSRLRTENVTLSSTLQIQMSERETHLMESILQRNDKIKITRSSMYECDYRVVDSNGNELLIERLRCTGEEPLTELESRISDDVGLFDQAERLQFIAENSDHIIIPVLLLEGNAHVNAQTMLAQQIDGAITFLTSANRISVLNTFNANHSGYVIAKLSEHFVNCAQTRPKNEHSGKPKALFEQKRYVIAAMPGISEVTAEALLRRFGSVKELAQATRRQIEAIEGMGPKKTKDLMRILGSD